MGYLFDMEQQLRGYYSDVAQGRDDPERMVEPNIAVAVCEKHLRVFVERFGSRSFGGDSRKKTDDRERERTQLYEEIRQTVTAVADIDDMVLRQQLFCTLTGAITAEENSTPHGVMSDLLGLKHEVLSGLFESSLTQPQAVQLYVEHWQGPNDDIWSQSQKSMLIREVLQHEVTGRAAFSRVEELLMDDVKLIDNVVDPFWTGFDELTPDAQQVLLRAGIDQGARGFVALMGYMNTEEQRRFLQRHSARSDVDHHLLTYDDISPDVLTISPEEVGKIARRYDVYELPINLGIQGAEEYDVRDWVAEAVRAHQQQIREACGDERLTDIAFLERSPTQIAAVDALYHQALDSNAEGLILDVLCRNQAQVKQQIHELLQRDGVSVADLCRRAYPVMKQGMAPGYTLEQLVIASGQPADEVASELIDATLETSHYSPIYVQRLVRNMSTFLQRENSQQETRRFTAARRQDVFGSISPSELLDRIADRGQCDGVLTFIDTIDDFQFATDWFYQRGLDRFIGRLTADDLHAHEFASLADIVMHRPDLMKRSSLSSQSRELITKLRETSSCMAACGPTKEGYRILDELHRGVVSDEARLIGVTLSGTKGVEQFRVVVQRLAQIFQQVEVSNDILHLTDMSPFVQSLVGQIYETDSGIYRANDRLGQTIHHCCEAGEHSLLPFSPLRYDIKTNRRNTSGFAMTPDLTERMALIGADIAAVEVPGGVDDIFDTLHQTVKHEYMRAVGRLRDIDTGVDEAYMALAPGKQRFYRLNEQRRIDGLKQALDQLAGDDRPDIADLFPHLYTVRSCQSSLRRLAMAEELKRMGPAAYEEVTAVDTTDVTITGVRVMSDFADRLVTSHQFAHPSVVKAYEGLFGAGILRQALRQYETSNDDTANMVTIDLIPTRGLGLELSGYVGDVCWTTQTQSLADNFPNITGVIMRRTSIDGRQRLVGSALMIETCDRAGNRVLALRGINPTENQIRKFDPASFLSAVIDYGKQMAATIGAVPAIALDQAGESSTNRPTLFDEMQRQLSALPLVDIADGELTASFNGYTLSGAARRVD